MFQPGLHRVVIARGSATGVLSRVSIGLNVTACALSFAPLLAWTVFGGAL